MGTKSAICRSKSSKKNCSDFSTTHYIFNFLNAYASMVVITELSQITTFSALHLN